MDTNRPHLCLTCGGSKRKKVMKYRAAGIRKANAGDFMKTWSAGLGKSVLGSIDGVLGAVGVNTHLANVVKDPIDSSTVFLGRKNAAPIANGMVNTAGIIGETTGRIGAQIGLKALGVPSVPKKDDTESLAPMQDSPIDEIPPIIKQNILEKSPVNPSNVNQAQTGGNPTKIVPTQGGLLKRLNSSAVVAKGNTHDEGGIMLDDETEVENNEGVHNIDGESVISSDVLRNKETDNSFAKDMVKHEKEKGTYENKLIKELEKTNGRDNYNTLLYKKRIKQLEDAIKDLYQQQEELAAKMGLRDNQGNPNETSQEVVGDEQAIKELQNQAEGQTQPQPQPQQEVPTSQRYGGNKSNSKMGLGGVSDKQKYGYKDNSPYRHNDYIDIDGDGNGVGITMKGVSMPILGVTDKGSVIMQPGGEYYYPDVNKVREIPLRAQSGGGTGTTEKKEEPVGKTKWQKALNYLPDITATAANINNAYAKRLPPKALPPATNIYPGLMYNANQEYARSLNNSKDNARKDMSYMLNKSVYSGTDSNPAFTTYLSAANKGTNDYMDKLAQQKYNNELAIAQEDLKKRDADAVYANNVYLNRAKFYNDTTQLRADALANQAKYYRDKENNADLIEYYAERMPVNQNPRGKKATDGLKNKFGGKKVNKKRFL